VECKIKHTAPDL